MCTIARSDEITINWMNTDKTIDHTTTCTIGGDVILPQTPYKYGYTFNGWRANYIPIEYLESTGTQYIDTGVVANNDSGIDILFYTIRKNSDSFILVQDNSFAFGISQGMSDQSNNFLIKAGANDIDNWIIRSFYGEGSGIYRFFINKQNASIYATDGSNVSHIFPRRNYKTNLNFILFALNTGSVVPCKNTQIYSCKLYDNDVLVRDFIPVLDPNGVPCMYDKVESKFYYNAGTGDFIAGPVIGE